MFPVLTYFFLIYTFEFEDKNKSLMLSKMWEKQNNLSSEKKGKVGEEEDPPKIFL